MYGPEMGKLYSRVRLMQEVTAADLCEACELSRSHLSEIESGKASGSHSTFTRIGEYLEVPLIAAEIYVMSTRKKQEKNLKKFLAAALDEALSVYPILKDIGKL
jgi:transcriptional regulator with XRE-family HTH domain